MLKMEDFLMLRDLYHQGMTISQISRETGYNRRTIRKYITTHQPPIGQKRSNKPSKLDDYKDYINERIREYPLSAARIYREIQNKGFSGGYTIVKDYVRQIRPKESISAVYRFETKPGVQAQVDWGECDRIEVDGQPRRLYCFSMILGYSRMRYMEFTLTTDVYTLIQCHLHAFEYFGGYTSEILYDNIKQVILKRAMKPKENTWNPKFEDFFSHYGFIPRLCKPYCPQTKGKIENTIGYMKRDFLLGSSFASLDDMNHQLSQWLSRVNESVHGTTHEIPAERLESENLKTLASVPAYVVRREEVRKVMRDGYVSYQGNRYSVPFQHAGQSVLLEIQGGRMTIRHGSECLCSHVMVPGKSRVIREKEHFKGLLSLAMKCNAQCRRTTKPLFRMIGPEVEHRPLSVYDRFSSEVK